MNGLSSAVNALIARIYDDVGEERPWISSLEALRGVIPCNTMAIEVVDIGHRQATYYFAAGRRVDASDIGIWEERDASNREPIPFEPGRVVVYHDWRREGASPGFLQLIEKYDVLRSMSVGILESDGARYSLHSGRSITEPTYSPWEQKLFGQLSGHFARAIGLRLNLNQARTSNELQADAMERLSVGGVIIDARRRVLFANDTASRLLAQGEGLALRRGVLCATATHVDAGLRRAIEAVLDAEPADARFPAVRALLVPRDGGRGNLYAVLRKQRIRERVSDRLQDAVQIYLHDPDLAYCKDATIYQQLFRFTRTEAAIATALGNGESVEAVERALGISHNTMRAHLRAIFSKTNVGSRAELVKILSNSAAPLANREQRPAGG